MLRAEFFDLFFSCVLGGFLEVCLVEKRTTDFFSSSEIVGGFDGLNSDEK
jgi:hypothetical protein